MIFYFAYGSNMDEEDLAKWCERKNLPIVTYLSRSPARLNGYKLSFNYYSTSRNGGAANIMEDKENCVYGLLIEIEDIDLETIRKKEGYSEDCSKCCYNEVCVNVERLSDGTKISHVKTYKVSKCRETTDDQCPTNKYIQLIIKNARKYKFPKEYIEYLESIKTKEVV